MTRHPIHVSDDVARNISFLRCLLSLAINLSEQGRRGREGGGDEEREREGGRRRERRERVKK